VITNNSSVYKVDHLL